MDDYLNYLPFNINVKADEISMYYGVESRSPFQDISLRKLAFSLPMIYKSTFLESKLVLRDIHNSRFNVHSYLPKKGFGANYSDILRRNDLSDLLYEFYSNSSKISSIIDCSYMMPLLTIILIS